MIHYVTGPLGAGKSFYAIKEAARALLEGKVVLGNVELVPNWAELLASHNRYVRFSRAKRREYVVELKSRFLYEPDLATLTRVRVRGRGEGRALLLLDEAHNDLNNRDWQREESREFLRWLSLARKRGIVGYVISQHKDNTDAGARRIATTHIQVVNYKQITRLPVLGTSLVPIPVFRATCLLNPEAMPSVERKKPLWRRWYFLTWHRKLYDSMQLFGEDDTGADSVWLPRSREDVRREALAVVGSSPAPAQAAPGVSGTRASEAPVTGSGRRA